MGCTSSKPASNRVSLEKGGGSSSSSSHGKSSASKFVPIGDKFQSLEEVQQALRKAGLESSNLIIGIDYTKSNTWNGNKTFGGRCLHHIEPGGINPYQDAISIIGETLAVFDDDNLIPAFGFGDSRTTDKSVFKFKADTPCYGFQEVLQCYNEITPILTLSGPTSFAPLIREAINIVRESGQYCILIIIADGEVTVVNETTKAIVEASHYPLSIITIGVGDGDWTLMEKFDDELPERQFDNFQFVEYNKVMLRAENRKVEFAVAALQEVPEQFSEIKRLGLLK